jgi:hypothetical protein
MQHADGDPVAGAAGERLGQVAGLDRVLVAAAVERADDRAVTLERHRLRLTRREVPHRPRKPQVGRPPVRRIVVPPGDEDRDPRFREAHRLLLEAQLGGHAAARVVDVAGDDQEVDLLLDAQPHDAIERLEGGRHKRRLHARIRRVDAREGRVEVQIGGVYESHRRHPGPLTGVRGYEHRHRSARG